MVTLRRGTDRAGIRLGECEALRAVADVSLQIPKSLSEALHELRSLPEEKERQPQGCPAPDARETGEELYYLLDRCRGILHRLQPCQVIYACWEQVFQRLQRLLHHLLRCFQSLVDTGDE